MFSIDEGVTIETVVFPESMRREDRVCLRFQQRYSLLNGTIAYNGCLAIDDVIIHNVSNTAPGREGIIRPITVFETNLTNNLRPDLFSYFVGVKFNVSYPLTQLLNVIEN